MQPSAEEVISNQQRVDSGLFGNWLVQMNGMCVSDILGQQRR